jgi:uncharacterized membrane protein
MEFETYINIPELLRKGFDYFRTHTSFLIGITVTFFVLAIIPNTYMMLYPVENESAWRTVLSLGLSILQMLLTLGVTRIMLDLVDAEPTHVSKLFSQFRYILDYFLANLIYIVVVGIGLAMLVFPGIYLAVRLQFYTFAILDEDLNFWEALHRSYELTEDWTWPLFLWGLVYLMVNFFGVMFFFVGAILTYPVTQIGMTILYRGLQRETKELP